MRDSVQTGNQNFATGAHAAGLHATASLLGSDGCLHQHTGYKHEMKSIQKHVYTTMFRCLDTTMAAATCPLPLWSRLLRQQLLLLPKETDSENNIQTICYAGTPSS